MAVATGEMAGIESGAGWLATKLAAVASEVTHVEKDGENKFFKYNYVSAEAMLTALRGPLIERHITLYPSLVGIAEREIKTQKGAASTITTATVDFKFVDGDTGYSETCRWAGQGDDPGDKGLSKAYTNAVKTFLRETFLIPQGDTPEHDPRADERADNRVPPAPDPMARARKKVLWMLSSAASKDEEVDRQSFVQAIERAEDTESLASIYETLKELLTAAGGDVKLVEQRWKEQGQ